MGQFIILPGFIIAHKNHFKMQLNKCKYKMAYALAYSEKKIQFSTSGLLKVVLYLIVFIFSVQNYTGYGLGFDLIFSCKF